MLLNYDDKKMKIEFTNVPNNEDIDFLTQKINEENSSFGAVQQFAFFVRDRAENIIAGCNGNLIFGVIYTDQLWVDKKYRGKGLGKQLMTAVHDYAKKMGCQMATVNTMSFQNAINFYEKLGYRIDFERLGYEQNSSYLFMRKIIF